MRYSDVQRVSVALFWAKLRAKADTMLWQLDTDEFEPRLTRAERDVEGSAEMEETIAASVLA